MVHCICSGASVRNGRPPGCSMDKHCNCPVLIHSLHAQRELHGYKGIRNWHLPIIAAANTFLIEVVLHATIQASSVHEMHADMVFCLTEGLNTVYKAQGHSPFPPLKKTTSNVSDGHMSAGHADHPQHVSNPFALPWLLLPFGTCHR